MSRDFLEINDILVCTDNSVSVGNLPLDDVHVPYRVVGYYLARVVLLELLSVGGQPVCYTLGNGTREGYQELHDGIKKLLAELRYSLPNISSSETNFTINQSSASISLIGKRVREFIDRNGEYALIGEPLVGEEVQQGNVAPLETVARLLDDKRVISVLPVGSKGIYSEGLKVFDVKLSSDHIDLYKSSGPSTCLIVKYDDESIIEEYGLTKLKAVL